MMMLDENLARMRAHRNNIHRYRRLLQTKLSDIERQFIERRLQEEHSAIAELTSVTFPIHFASPKNLTSQPHDGRQAVSDVRDALIRGSVKVIEHYRFLLSRTPNERERDLYRQRIVREQQLLDDLLQGGHPAQRAA